MTILDPNKLEKFRKKLYNKRVSKLLHQGGKGLNPLGKYKKDEKGRPLAQTQKITRFFLGQMEKAGSALPDEYLTALFTLFQAMSRGAEPISFDCGFSISQEDIQAADNKAAIELLTTNIIITYFNTLKTYKGTVDTTLLSPGLAALISKSNAGRDYKGLVSKTLTGLIHSLGEDRPWRDYLEDLNHADLVCQLAGARLPSMEKKAMTRIIEKSRKEILVCTEIFTKILHTQDQLASREINKKIFLKSMEKLDAATITILKRTETYLVAAHRLMGILNLSYPAILGETDSQLRQNLVWLFLGVKPGKTKPSDSSNRFGIATTRYRLNLLFNYPNITQYSRSFKTSQTYGPIYFDIFRVLLKDATEKITQVDITAKSRNLAMIHLSLGEIARAIRKLGIEDIHLQDEKLALKQSYVSLIQKADFINLKALMEICDPICGATQDQAREIMLDIRSALVNACFSSQVAYAQKAPAPDKTLYGIKKRLNAFAMHYKPQREFYRIFFDTYMCSGSVHPSPHLTDLINTNKSFATALLMVYSDKKSMKDLISAKRISNAAALLDQLIQGN